MSNRAVTGAEAAVGFSGRTLAASSLDSDRGRIDRVIVLQGSRSTEKECVEADFFAAKAINEKENEKERENGRTRECSPRCIYNPIPRILGGESCSFHCSRLSGTRD